MEKPYKISWDKESMTMDTGITRFQKGVTYRSKVTFRMHLEVAQSIKHRGTAFSHVVFSARTKSLKKKICSGSPVRRPSTVPHNGHSVIQCHFQIRCIHR